MDWKYAKYHHDSGAMCYKDEVLEYAQKLRDRGLKPLLELKLENRYFQAYPVEVVVGAVFSFEDGSEPITVDFRVLRYGRCLACGFRGCLTQDDFKEAESCFNCKSDSVVIQEHRHFLYDSSNKVPKTISQYGPAVPLPDALIAIRDWMVDAGVTADYVANRCVVSCPKSRCQVILSHEECNNNGSIDFIEVVDLRPRLGKQPGSKHTIDLVDPLLFTKLQSLVDGIFWQQFMV
jgi:hypothetical protein